MSESKKKFTVQSPYTDYAADNDLCTEEMEKRAAEENVQPDKKQIIKSALTAAALVAVFALIGLVFSCVGGLFSVTPTVGVYGYSQSDDGSELTIETIVSDSYRFARAYRVQQEGDGLYITFYQYGAIGREAIEEKGFGGSFTLMPESSVNHIYFCREDGFELVLIKDESTGMWINVNTQ